VGNGYFERTLRLKVVKNFPLDQRCLEEMRLLKQRMEDTSMQVIDESLSLVIKCDVPEVAILATLSKVNLVNFLQPQAHRSGVE